jgi:hypothetical protein
MELIAWPLVGLLVDQVNRQQQRRRKVQVLVHRAYFMTMPDSPTASPPVTGYAPGPEYFFIKVTNLSSARDVSIGHMWFEAEPQVHIVDRARPFPVRLRPDETVERWIPVSQVPEEARRETSVRVRLSTGRIVKSGRNKDMPPVGFVAPPGNP